MTRDQRDKRRFPVGAEVLEGGGVHFRVWAPKRTRVEVVLEASDGEGRRAVALSPEDGGYFAKNVADARVGDRYRFRLDGGDSFPDPASRFQPEGPHGPSEVVDPKAFRFTDAAWKGVGRKGLVAYELHIGTFTKEGTFAAAEAALPKLAELGINLVEVMPINEFPGRFGWGYDGVGLYAPTHLYGRPDDVRRFVDRAHSLGVGVILDVVYNHFGPDGNYLSQFSDHYFTKKNANEWGDAIDFDGPESAGVREFFVHNAGYWIEEFHFDGLRLDATQSILDTSPRHVVTELGERARKAAGDRSIVITAENEPQDAVFLREREVDAMWNDDFHHAAVVALTGRNEAYYTDYRGTPQELISALKWGFLYQGQNYKWQKQPRGTPSLTETADRFFLFLENHDQVANWGCGSRLRTSTSPGRWRAMTTLLLLGPATPMLFQGQEFGSEKRFTYFADHGEELARLVKKGRHDFLTQFPSSVGLTDRLPDPADEALFQACKIDLDEYERNPPVLQLHRDLLRLRRQDRVFAAQDKDRMHGAVLADEAFVLRFFGEDGDDRLLLVNLGRDLDLSPIPEPLLAPTSKGALTLLWSSEDARFGGNGTPPIFLPDGAIHLPGHAAVVLTTSKETR